jgi:hypothetical protein
MLFFLEDTRLVRQVPDVAFILRALANVGDHAVWTEALEGQSGPC